uniref:UPF0481 protein At3g47200-like n=1 Tax=Nicotiana tabacum TaxID=4097 RepID=A0A1S4CHW0_TOBAC|nr:PREDICTED: UPF0481 protein At3g47200-like [Nicotiana tabacum]
MKPDNSTKVKRNQIQKVPSFLSDENKESGERDPKVVSLGPYHHGKEKLKFVQDFKPMALDMFIEGSNQDKAFFLGEILKEIEYAKSCYLEEFTCIYDDFYFAEMMLLDACFILNIIGPWDQTFKRSETIEHLGTAVYTLSKRDLYLLENQVPLRILMILAKSRYPVDEKGFIETAESSCFNILFHEDIRSLKDNKQGTTDTPLHLLEIFRRSIVTGTGEIQQPRVRPCDPLCDIFNKLGLCLEYWCCRKDKTSTRGRGGYVFHSVTDLKSKGIHFRPSEIASLNGVRFSPAEFCHSAKLKLPYWYVSPYTRSFFMNMIAYEFCPNVFTDKAVTAYVNFMKSLIVSQEDVKELREKKILMNSLGSDEQVVQVYKSLNTYGTEDESFFHKEKRNIEDHYNNKTRTWLSELKNTYFNSPWSIIALVGSIFLLCSDIVQTYYAVHPSKGGS